MSQWLAGAAEVVITPPVGVELEGYGNRKDVSTGVHDDLLAHALVLDDGERKAAIVTCDVISVDAPIVAAVREAAREQWGIPPERLVLACSHTHAGPRGLLRLRASADPDLIAITTRKIVGAIRAASGNLAPADLMVGSRPLDSVGLNRRSPDGPVDGVLRVLRVEEPGGRLVAALINYALHPTVLNADNLRITQDWPGYACRAVKALWGEDVVVLFANGACADVNPVKITETFEEVRRVGTIVGAEAARMLGELAAHGRDQVVHNLRFSEHSHKPPSLGRAIAPRVAGARVPVTLPWKQFASDEQYQAWTSAMRAELGAIPAGEVGAQRRRATMPRWNALRAEAATAGWGRRGLAEHPEGFATEVQALALGREALIVTAPGELMVDIGKAISSASPAPETLVVAYANDAAGYLVTDTAHDEGGYEAGRSLFTRGVESRLKAAAAHAARAAWEDTGQS